MGMGFRVSLGGVAQVYCVHDREKRIIRNPDDCVRVAQDAGMVLLAHPKFQTCGCCENVFASLDDAPQLCPGCNGQNVHKMGGPLNDPIEGVF